MAARIETRDWILVDHLTDQVLVATQRIDTGHVQVRVVDVDEDGNEITNREVAGWIQTLVDDVDPDDHDVILEALRNVSPRAVLIHSPEEAANV